MNAQILCFGICISAMPAIARLDETESACIQRYGQPVTTSYQKSTEPTFTRNYKMGDFLIQFTFIKGVAVEARYSLYVTANRSKLLDAEVTAILEAESGGGTWKPTSQSMAQYLVQTNSKNWTNTTGAKATYDGRTTIHLSSSTADAKKEALKAEKNREAEKNIPKF